jgi:alginate biosynthesis protein AlgX
MSPAPNPPTRRLAHGAATALMAAVSALAGLMPLHVTAADADPALPSYAALPCCSLCPRAADPEAYVTTSMKGAMLLAEGVDGWLFRTEMDLVEDVRPIDPLLYEDMARLRKALKARGVQVVLISSPPRGLVEYQKLGPSLRERYDYARALANYRAHLERLRGAGFLVPDTSTFANEFGDNDENFYFKRDLHWTSNGARRTAELVAATIRDAGLQAALPQKAYSSRPLGTKSTYGTISRAATQLCGGRYAAEVLPLHTTVAPPSDDLFGDEAAPQVTLVGTSFSENVDYHFAGFLQSQLQTDVLNAAFAGGNFDGAITQYLLSEEFQKAPPKILIWETAYQFFSTTERIALRRLIPLVDDACARRPALFDTETVVPGGNAPPVELIYNGGDAQNPAKSRELVLDLQFSDPAVKDVSAEIWYLDGSNETLRSRYNAFTNTNGRYAFELSRDGANASVPVVAVRAQVLSPLAKPAKVKARLCRTTAK